MELRFAAIAVLPTAIPHHGWYDLITFPPALHSFVDAAPAHRGEAFGTVPGPRSEVVTPALRAFSNKFLAHRLVHQTMRPIGWVFRAKWPF